MTLVEIKAEIDLVRAKMNVVAPTSIAYGELTVALVMLYDMHMKLSTMLLDDHKAA